MGRTGGRSSRRTAPRTTRRAGHAQPARRTQRRRPSVGWARRLGIAGALVIAGASVVLAGQALLPDGPRPTPSAGSGSPSDSPAPQPTLATPQQTLPAAPVLDQPDSVVVTTPVIELTGRLIGSPPREGHRLRVYVNGELVRDRRLPRREQFALPDIPLVEGVNSITAAVAGPTGESLHSAAVHLTLDTTAPTVQVLEPTASVIFQADVTVRGISEPGAMLTARDAVGSEIASLVVGQDGSFEFTARLVLGLNELVLEARDAAGHTGGAGLVLERREAQASVRLSLSVYTISRASLPRTVTVRTRLFDRLGQPVTGAEVTLSISPPGLPTLTHQAISVNGAVSWSGVRISDDAEKGIGIATVVAILPDGDTVQESVYFTIE